MRNAPEEVIKALLQKRQILLIGKIDNDAQEIISGYIIYLNSLGSDPISLFIDSTGGFTDAEVGLVDVISISHAPVHGVVTRVAFSAAFGLLQACRVRKAYPHAMFMFHAPRIKEMVVDNEEKLNEDICFFRQLHDEQIESYSKRSGQPKESWIEWSRKEKRFTAQEALTLKMIDEIIQPVPLPISDKD
ncbi:MAG: ATP-dependent Clp protease proteolytic subunit [Candidatus Zambryskibacteria bacterium]